jgi:hypothetical protein
MKTIAIITLLFFITSCKWITGAKVHNLAFTNIRVPPGTPNFQKGYKDGCSTVLYSRGNTFYRTKYSYRLDADLIDDSEYYFGRKRGYNFCFGYITGASGHLSKGWDAYIYGQGTPFDMGKGNINDTVIGRPSGSQGGKTANVFDTWGDMKGGVGGSLGVLQKNRTNDGGVFGGHIFYGKTSKQMNQILGW